MGWCYALMVQLWGKFLSNTAVEQEMGGGEVVQVSWIWLSSNMRRRLLNIRQMSLIRQSQYLPSNTSFTDCFKTINFNPYFKFFLLISPGCTLNEFNPFFSFFDLQCNNISDSAEQGLKQPNWFHYSQGGYDRPRKCHFRNPSGTPCSAATHPAHLMESVHCWFPYQWSWNVRGVMWTSPPDTAELIKQPRHVSGMYLEGKQRVDGGIRRCAPRPHGWCECTGIICSFYQ